MSMAVPDQRPPSRFGQCLARSFPAAAPAPSPARRHRAYRPPTSAAQHPWRPACCFGLLSRSSHVDQREAGNKQRRQDGYDRTEGHPIFRPDVSDDVSDDFHASNSAQSRRGLPRVSGQGYLTGMRSIRPRRALRGTRKVGLEEDQLADVELPIDIVPTDVLE